MFGTAGLLLLGSGSGQGPSLCSVVVNASAVLYELLHVRVPHPSCSGGSVLEVRGKVRRVDRTGRPHLLLLVLPDLVHVRESCWVARVKSVGEGGRRVDSGDLVSGEGRVRVRVREGGGRRVLDVRKSCHDSSRAWKLSERGVGGMARGERVLFVVGGCGFV